MNAGRNTHPAPPLPPQHHNHEELAEESADSEHRFINHVIQHGIPLADFEDET